jgi:hypothetical protein
MNDFRGVGSAGIGKDAKDEHGDRHMEHRWSTRKLLSRNVVVECPRVGLVRATMRDVSLGGMFVETGNTALPLHAPISVVFNLSPTKRDGDYCLPAMIVRHTSKGSGIMFLDPDAEALRSLRATLYGDSPAGPNRLSGASASGSSADPAVPPAIQLK